MANRRRQVSTSTIDNLIGALTRFKEYNEASLQEGGFWIESSNLDRVRCAVEPEDQARDARVCIGELSAMHKALDILRISCQDRLEGLRKEFAGPINKAGLLSLPNELLQVILTKAASSEDILPGKKTFAVSISQVCRRLRGCAHHTPDLWCRLSSNMHLKELDSRIRLSRNHLFDIEVHATDPLFPPANIGESLQILKGIKEQWRSFSFKCCDYMSWKIKAHTGFFKVLNKHLSDLELPELESLHIIDITGRNLFSEEQGISFDFYESWEMPKLRNFESVFNLPCSVSVRENLVSAFLWITTCPEDATGMFHFLNLCPNLRELTLKVGNPHSHELDRLGIFSSKTVTLNKLKSLKLIVSDPYTVKAIRSHLITPAVERVGLDIRYDPTKSFAGQYMVDVFRGLEPLKIKDLEVNLHTNMEAKFDVVYHILSRFKHLSRLSVEASDTEIYTEYPGEMWTGILPPLHTVSFRNCTKLDPKLVDNLGSCEGLSTLEIVQPPVFNTDSTCIGNSSIRDKLAWYRSSGYNNQVTTHDLEPDDNDNLACLVRFGNSDSSDESDDESLGVGYDTEPLCF